VFGVVNTILQSLTACKTSSNYYNTILKRIKIENRDEISREGGKRSCYANINALENRACVHRAVTINTTVISTFAQQVSAPKYLKSVF
jgi:hypothetical protein